MNDETMVIPGQMTELELAELGKVASLVRPNGCAVEIGSLYGLSSAVIAKSISEKATLFCVDPWVREPWIIELVEKKTAGCPQFSKDAFMQFTGMHLNIVPLQGYSPKDFLGWNIEIDLLFEDSMHQNPELNNTLCHWSKHLRKGGIICGHDYCEQWPDVILEVDKMAAELGITPLICETFWWMQTK